MQPIALHLSNQRDHQHLVAHRVQQVQIGRLRQHAQVAVMRLRQHLTHPVLQGVQNPVMRPVMTDKKLRPLRSQDAVRRLDRRKDHAQGTPAVK